MLDKNLIFLVSAERKIRSLAANCCDFHIDENYEFNSHICRTKRSNHKSPNIFFNQPVNITLKNVRLFTTWIIDSYDCIRDEHLYRRPSLAMHGKLVPYKIWLEI